MNFIFQFSRILTHLSFIMRHVAPKRNLYFLPKKGVMSRLKVTSTLSRYLNISTLPGHCFVEATLLSTYSNVRLCVFALIIPSVKVPFTRHARLYRQHCEIRFYVEFASILTYFDCFQFPFILVPVSTISFEYRRQLVSALGHKSVFGW